VRDDAGERIGVRVETESRDLRGVIKQDGEVGVDGHGVPPWRAVTDTSTLGLTRAAVSATRNTVKEERASWRRRGCARGELTTTPVLQPRSARRIDS
jgi:hypothetical protein